MKKLAVFTFILLTGYFAKAQDLRVLSIQSPSTACGHTNAETVQIQIFNAGAVTVFAPYTISYTVNGGAPVNQVINNPADSIQAGNFLLKSFATPVNMSVAQLYNFKSYVTLAGDINNANDTTTKAVSSDANTIPGVVTADDTVCQGTNGDTLILSGNVGTVTGWVRGTTPISNTDTFLIYSNLTQTSSYRAIVRNGTCPFDTSAPAVITVDSITLPGTITGPAAACIGSSGALNLTGNRGAVVDWETATNALGPWSGASNTTTTFNYVNIQTTSDTLFRAIVKLGICPADTTPVKTLNLDAPSVGGTVGQTVGNDTVCSGANNGTLLLSGETGTVVEWQASTGGAFAAAGSPGSNTFTFTNIVTTTSYRAMVMNGTCAAVPSDTFTITVDQPSLGGTISNDATVCANANFGTLNLGGHVGNVIRWDSATAGPGGPYFPISNTTLNQSYSNLSLTTYYRAVVQNGTCPPAFSALATITVNSLSNGGTISPAGPITVCAGTNTGMFSVAGINGTILRWESSINNGASWTNTGISTNNYTFNNLADTTLFRVLVQNGGCPIAFSDTVQVNVAPATVAGVINGTANVCFGSLASLNLTGQSGTVLKWRESTNGGASYSDIAGSAGQTTINPFILSSSQYIAVVQLGTCSIDTTAPFVVTPDAFTIPGTVTPDDTICSGGTASVNLTGNSGSVIRWESSTNNGMTWVDEGNPGTTTFNTGALLDTTLIRAIVQSGSCPIDSSSSATIKVLAPAVGGIATVAPPNDTVCEGLHAVVVNLTGFAPGSILRWESSTGGPFVDEGVNSASQAFNKNFTATTTFRAIVQNGAGCPTAISTTDDVVVNPTTMGGSISAASTTVCGGSNTGTINLVGNVGSVLRWEESTNFGPFTAVVPANTSTSLSYSGLNDTTQYRVIVKSGECPQAISDTATIQIIPAAVGGQVTGALATPLCASDTVQRTLTLTGATGTVVEWQTSPTGAVWTPAGNAGSSTFNYRASTLTGTTHFRVQLQAGACPAVFSQPDTVVLDVLSNAGTVNGSTSLCDTGNSGFVNLTAFVGNVLNWQISSDGVAFTDIPSSANDTFFYSNLLDTTYYRAIVQNGSCGNDTSGIATINVSPSPVGGTINGSATYCNLTNTTLLQLTGYTGTIVGWEESVNGGPFVAVVPATTVDTLRRNDITQNTDYRVIVSSGACGNDTSSIASITVGQSIGGTINSSIAYCDTINNDTLFLTGFLGSIVNWESSTDGVTFTPFAPALTSDTFVYNNIKDTTFYRVVVQNGTCPTDTSDTATIRIDPVAIGGLLSQSRSFCDTLNHDTLLLTGFQGNILNWESSVDTGKTWVPFAPALVSDTFIYTDIKVTTLFRVQVGTGGSCTDSASNVVTIGIGPAQSGIISGPDTICSGSNSDTLRLSAFVGDSVFWQTSIDSTIWTNTANDTTFQPLIGLSGTTFFRVIVSNDTCGVDTSAGFRVEILPGSVAGIINGDVRVCFNDTNQKILDLDGTIGNILFWESRDTGTAWVNIPSTNDTIFYKNLQFPTTYRAIVQNGFCNLDTATVTVAVDSLNIAGSLIGNDTVCAGNNSGVIRTVGSSGITYTWESSTNEGQNWGVMTAGPDTFFTFNNLIDTSLFRVVVSNGGCPADTSDTVRIVVKPVAVGGTILSDTSFCEGPNAGTLTLTGHTGNVLDWEFSTDSTTFTPVGNTLAVLAYNNVSQTTLYRAIVGLGDCPNDTSSIATITIESNPSVSITGSGPLEFCEGTTVTLTAIGGPTYLWSTAETTAAIDVNTDGVYSVTVTDTSTANNCTASDSVTVTVFPLPVIVALRDTTIDFGEEVVLAAQGGATYVWAPVTGLNNNVSPNPIASPAETTTYLLIGTDANGCVGTDSLTVTVNTDLTPQFTNLFTPDGDGINDTWMIGNLVNCLSCKLIVFNRYGQEVFNATNYQNDWDGTFDGKKLPDGTYYFVLQNNDDGKIYKGAVTILRGE